MSPFALVPFERITVGDEASFAHVALYSKLKRVVRDANIQFRVFPEAYRDRWDRTLLLNLTYWGIDGGGDVLEAAYLDADVVTHIAWHHLAAKALLEQDGKMSAEAMFLGESIASAFDIYLVGRLLEHAPDSSFLETQVPAMEETAAAAGLDAESFSALLESVASAPERAFEDLRQLLFDATRALHRAASAEDAFSQLQSFDGHRFAPLLHRYELSNWVLYAKAHTPTNIHCTLSQALDETLRTAGDSLLWLERNWLARS